MFVLDVGVGHSGPGWGNRPGASSEDAARATRQLSCPGQPTIVIVQRGAIRATGGTQPLPGGPSLPALGRSVTRFHVETKEPLP